MHKVSANALKLAFKSKHEHINHFLRTSALASSTSLYSVYDHYPFLQSWGQSSSCLAASLVAYHLACYILQQKISSWSQMLVSNFWDTFVQFFAMSIWNLLPTVEKCTFALQFWISTKNKFLSSGLFLNDLLFPCCAMYTVLCSHCTILSLCVCDCICMQACHFLGAFVACICAWYMFVGCEGGIMIAKHI